MSGLGFCKECGKLLISFEYEIIVVGEKYEFTGIKCSECDYKMPKQAVEIIKKV